MTDLDPVLLSPKLIRHNESDIRNRLMPVLRQENIPRARNAIKLWAENLTQELQKVLNRILPLRENEIDFISKIRKLGEIDASVITDDSELQTIVNYHPAVQWAAKQAQGKNGN